MEPTRISQQDLPLVLISISMVILMVCKGDTAWAMIGHSGLISCIEQNSRPLKTIRQRGKRKKMQRFRDLRGKRKKKELVACKENKTAPQLCPN